MELLYDTDYAAVAYHGVHLGRGVVVSVGQQGFLESGNLAGGLPVLDARHVARRQQPAGRGEQGSANLAWLAPIGQAAFQLPRLQGVEMERLVVAQLVVSYVEVQPQPATHEVLGRTDREANQILELDVRRGMRGIEFAGETVGHAPAAASAVAAAAIGAE